MSTFPGMRAQRVFDSYPCPSLSEAGDDSMTLSPLFLELKSSTSSSHPLLFVLMLLPLEQTSHVFTLVPICTRMITQNSLRTCDNIDWNLST